jgi:serine O-acetyltransferase
MDTLEIWDRIRGQVSKIAGSEPVLRRYLVDVVLNRDSMAHSLACLLAGKLALESIQRSDLEPVLLDAFSSFEVSSLINLDLAAVANRDPAARGVANPFLNHKGFHALQVHRAAHSYWLQGREALALFLQSRSSEIFAVDIHPAARIGRGVFIDHATGVVIGETAVLDDDVSLLQDVTLGGTGKESGDRHPKIGKGVLICAGAKILGNIHVGAGSKVGAGSVVLHDVPPHTTVVGVPARPVGRPRVNSPALNMDQHIEQDPFIVRLSA